MDDIDYKVTGHDKKLLSDKYLPVDGQRGYRLSMQFRCADSVLMHIGIACYDKDRKLISPVQVYSHRSRCAGEKTLQSE